MSTILNWLGGIAVLVAVMAVIGIPFWLWESRARKKKMEEVLSDALQFVDVVGRRNA